MDLVHNFVFLLIITLFFRGPLILVVMDQVIRAYLLAPVTIYVFINVLNVHLFCYHLLCVVEIKL